MAARAASNRAGAGAASCGDRRFRKELHMSRRRVASPFLLFAALALVLPPALVAEDLSTAAVRQVRFKEARMIIEFNASAEDIGIQFFLDSEGWKSVQIVDPRGERIFSSSADGALLGQGGGTEMFVESVEPSLEDLSLEEFFDRFPAGRYRFTGRAPDGTRLARNVQFSHVVPEGPEIVLPGAGEECATGVGIPAVIQWEPVEETIDGEPVEIAGYEVIVENGEVFDVHLPGDATRITVPAEFLTPGTDYIFEVLAIEEGGNQTITEGCFRTAG
jgi:hypothetical protein